MWPFKQIPSTVPDDVAEAQRMRESATAELARVERRTPAVTALAEFLAARRAENHFGDAIQITFTRRRDA